MYEAEVNHLVEPLDALPPEIQGRFSESRGQIVARTVLPWGEHCTECNWPTCYTTCELYSPRQDGGCRLFVTGMMRIPHKEAVNGYVLKIQFKRWGKLWTVGNLNLLPLSTAARRERANITVGAVARSIPLPPPLKRRVLGKVSYIRRQRAEAALPSLQPPDCFMLECYNPNPAAMALTFTVRTRGGESTQAFQQMVTVPPGFTRERIRFHEIAQRIDTQRPFDVEIVPNECTNAILYFGLLDFVHEHPCPSPKQELVAHGEPKKWKCIVWDLDHTLWDGILIEDGPEKLRVRQAAIDVIKETDRRGILHSIASKNSHEAAMKVLKQSGLDDYFLHPQINWGPKSESIARIAQLLNIGRDTIAFVDDQQFERAEVKTALPEVSVIDSIELGGVPHRLECQVPITEESTRRRLMYREEGQRGTVLKAFAGDYLGFLRECNIRLRMAPLNEVNLDRVYELAQRTNQMNFSGNRYPRVQLEKLLQSKSHETCVISCTDRFGNYGIVGFAVVEPAEPRLLDLMFSCRIQGKRVEHAVLGHFLKRFVGERAGDFFANYRPTPKNAQSGKVFEEVGFKQNGEQEGLLSLVFRKGVVVPDDKIITIAEGTE